MVFKPPLHYSKPFVLGICTLDESTTGINLNKNQLKFLNKESELELHVQVIYITRMHQNIGTILITTSKSTTHNKYAVS